MHKDKLIETIESVLLGEDKSDTSGEFKKLLKKHEEITAKRTKLFNKLEEKAKAIKAKAKGEVKAIQKQQSDLVNKPNLQDFAQMKKDADKLGYHFKAIGGWQPK